MKKDKRAVTSRENGRKGGRPQTQAEPLEILVAVRLTLTQAQWVTEHGGSKYIRDLIEVSRTTPD